ncbi:hypothetical protein [Streptomyces sp. NPDC058145]|uniref:hypothetical protein n=1 Tax=Streptomyces sp. NPDC058145 TaxID=3346356 RepID=UPI0036E90F8A
MPAELVSQVRSALIEAGFQVLGDGDGDDPGLRVREVSEGVVISWSASDGFVALSRERAARPPSDDSMRVIVQAAVSGLLVQLGHTVAETPDGGDLLVLAEAVAQRDDDGR